MSKAIVKKMLSSEKIVVSVKNAIPEKMDDISDFVRVIVRHNELEATMKTLKKPQEIFEKEHVGVDFMSATDETIIEAFEASEKFDGAVLNAIRKLVNELNEELEACIHTYEEFSKLGATDKAFLVLQAHMAMSKIVLPESILGSGDDAIDVAGMVEKYYKNGKISAGKDFLRTLFKQVVGEQGTLFYGVKMKKSDFDAEDVRTFFASFRGTAKQVKEKDGTVRYVYVKKDEAVSAQLDAITTLFSVTLDRHNDYEVIKPEQAATESEAA